MLTPDCKPKQIEHNEEKALWISYNENTKEQFIGLFNLSEHEKRISINMRDIEEEKNEVNLLELWSKKEWNSEKGVVTAVIKPHDCCIFKVL